MPCSAVQKIGGLEPRLFYRSSYSSMRGGVTDRLTFNYPSWSVSAEFFVYLLFPVFLFVIRRFGLWTALLIPCLCAIINVIQRCSDDRQHLARPILGCILNSFLA